MILSLKQGYSWVLHGCHQGTWIAHVDLIPGMQSGSPPNTMSMSLPCLSLSGSRFISKYLHKGYLSAFEVFSRLACFLLKMRRFCCSWVKTRVREKGETGIFHLRIMDFFLTKIFGKKNAIKLHFHLFWPFLCVLIHIFQGSKTKRLTKKWGRAEENFMLNKKTFDKKKKYEILYENSYFSWKTRCFDFQTYYWGIIYFVFFIQESHAVCYM